MRHPAETIARLIHRLMTEAFEVKSHTQLDAMADIEDALQVMVTLAGGRAGWQPDRTAE